MGRHQSVGSTGVHECGKDGYTVDFDYSDVCVGSTGDACIRDIKRLVDSYSTCSQAFEYHCIGSVFQHTDTSGRDGYQCINNASIKLVDYSVDPGVTGVSYGTRNCDRNDAVERMDTGTLPQSVLPVTRWLPGDIDGAGEGGTLVLKELKCTNTPTLKLNCAGLGVGVQLVKPAGAVGSLRVTCDGMGGVQIGPDSKSTGRHQSVGSTGVHECGKDGYTVDFDYSDVCVGST